MGAAWLAGDEAADFVRNRAIHGAMLAAVRHPVQSKVSPDLMGRVVGAGWPAQACGPRGDAPAAAPHDETWSR